MTIGIAAVGPGAGRAIIRGLTLAETIGEGSIGGFVSFASVDRHGQVHRCSVQQGGAVPLRSEIQDEVNCLDAERAVLMSSGPNRPEPLSQFVLASPEGCLVTGHRFPNTPREGQAPLNIQLLASLSNGRNAPAAVQGILASNPMADAGLVAIDKDGQIHSGNSARVASRHDLGTATLVAVGGLSVSVIHNAIWPVQGLADIIAQSVLRDMQIPTPFRSVTVSAGTPVKLAEEDAVTLSADGSRVACIYTRDPALIAQPSDGAAIYSGAFVYLNGHSVGRMISEPYTQVANSQIQSLDGQAVLSIRYQLCLSPEERTQSVLNSHQGNGGKR